MRPGNHYNTVCNFFKRQDYIIILLLLLLYYFGESSESHALETMPHAASTRPTRTPLSFPRHPAKVKYIHGVKLPLRKPWVKHRHADLGLGIYAIQMGIFGKQQPLSLWQRLLSYFLCGVSQMTSSDNCLSLWLSGAKGRCSQMLAQMFQTPNRLIWATASLSQWGIDL